MNKQKGITFIGLIVSVVLSCMLLLTLVKIIPLYLEYRNVATVLNHLADDKQLGANSNVQENIREKLRKNFEINNVKSVLAKNVQINYLHDNQFEVIADYSPQVHLFSNFDLVIHFNKSVTVDARD